VRVRGSGSPSSTRARSGRQRVAERREATRLAEVGLRVADPDLDRREREVRADAPPELRVLVIEPVS
jgi:hypothetical protein